MGRLKYPFKTLCNVRIAPTSYKSVATGQNRVRPLAPTTTINVGFGPTCSELPLNIGMTGIQQILMNLSSQLMGQFAHDAHLSPEELRAIMYPKPQRKHKTTKERFVPPTPLSVLNSPPPSENVPEELPTKVKGQVPKQPLIEGQIVNPIDLFLRKEESKFQNLQPQFPDSEVQEFILFHPSLKTVPSAIFCLGFFRQIRQRQGLIHVLASRQFHQALKSVLDAFTICDQYSEEMLFSFYRQHILPFEMFKMNHLHSFAPTNIDRVKVFSHHEMDHIVKNQLEEQEFNRDIFVVNNFSEYVGYDTSILSTEYFGAKYGDWVIDTRIQKNDAMGFDVYNGQMFNAEETMKASDYLAYQNLEGTPEVKRLPISKKLKKGEVCFAVNVDLLNKGDIEGEVHSKMDKVKFFQYINALDALSYCEEWIPGCNHPQVYFKVKGVWTGGHQENVSMCSVNVNLGPGDSEWTSLAIEHVPRLRKQVMEEFQTDIISEEGLWFVSPEWLIVNNYPVKKLIQKKGDLVFSGPGTLHWVRSLGKCMQIAWNLFQKTAKQWEIATQRMKINEEIHFNHIFMPLKAIAIKILNHEYHKNSEFVQKVYGSIKEWFNEETLFVNNSVIKRDGVNYLVPEYRPLKDIDSICEECKSEILTIYSLDSNEYAICIKCYAQLSPKLRTRTYLKYHQESVKELLTRVKLLENHGTFEENPEVSGLCNGVFCGVVECVHAEDILVEENLTTKADQDSLKHEESTNQKSAEMCLQLDNSVKINAVEILQLLSSVLPQKSWTSTEEVLLALSKEIASSNPNDFTQFDDANPSPLDDPQHNNPNHYDSNINKNNSAKQNAPTSSKDKHSQTMKKLKLSDGNQV